MAVDKTGAPGDITQDWRAIDWQKARSEVRRLQMRIAKAVKEGKHGKGKALQRIFTHSFYAKAVAVKRVTSNTGNKPPGIDGVLWKTASAKMQAVRRLRQHGYRAQPLRRIYIRKKSGKLRPLSIPTMLDRARQALYKLALAPVAETTADRNSYGFREGRRCADAIAAALNALSKPNSATGIWEADISGCFDTSSPSWVLEHIPMERRRLKHWLEAGDIEDNTMYPTRKGTPQGGIISPMIANMVLDGLEDVIRRAIPRRSRVNVIRYADDVIVTAKSRRLLEKDIIPAVIQFLAERGLTLSEEKRQIVFIRDGVTFLGQTFRKHGNTLHITPSKEGVLALLRKVGTLIRKYVSAPVEALIKKLNQTLRGWANYHRHVVASEAFSRVDTSVYEPLWSMRRRNPPEKSKGWLIKRYWTASGMKWRCSVIRKTRKGLLKLYQVLRVSSIGMKRHIKIKADANPYLAEYALYFANRRQNKEACLMRKLSARAMRKTS